MTGDVQKTKILFLVSGNGGTLKFLNMAAKQFSYPFTVTGVIADRNCGAYEYALKENIPAEIVNYSKENDSQLINCLKRYDAHIIITNIHKILTANVLNSVNAEFINLHYSLLPAFAGLIGMKTGDAAKRQNCRFLGATCHRVSTELDAGEILCQGIYPVNWEDDIDRIYNKVFQIACLTLLNVLIGTGDRIYTSDDYILNPGFKFNPKNFNKDFWMKLKNT